MRSETPEVWDRQLREVILEAQVPPVAGEAAGQLYCAEVPPKQKNGHIYCDNDLFETFQVYPKNN